jgi:uncharacterized RDD family membrane protein YckC
MTKNSSIKSAGGGLRIFAFLLDVLVILLIGAVVFAISMAIYGLTGGIPEFNELQMNLLGLTIIIPAILYCILTENSSRHATFGKRKMKIRVENNSGKQPTTSQIITRNIIKFLPWQLAHMAIFHAMALNWELDYLTLIFFILAGYILPIIWLSFVIFRKDQRGIHDLIAKTIVLKGEIK